MLRATLKGARQQGRKADKRVRGALPATFPRPGCRLGPNSTAEGRPERVGRHTALGEGAREQSDARDDWWGRQRVGAARATEKALASRHAGGWGGTRPARSAGPRCLLRRGGAYFCKQFGAAHSSTARRRAAIALADTRRQCGPRNTRPARSWNVTTSHVSGNGFCQRPASRSG